MRKLCLRRLRLSERIKMAQRLKRGGRKKYGLGTPVHTPQYHSEPTETAKVPMWQADGVKYVTKEDFQWLIDNGHIEMKMPEEVKEQP